MTRLRITSLVGLGIVPAVWAGAAKAQEGDRATIETVRVADGVYMLVGRGGNIGVCAGTDGVILIDDQFAPLTPKILSAVSKINERPIKFVLNTHWHGDHTGGNENLGKAGAVIVAHENVRETMSEEQFMKAFGQTVPPAPKEALPIVTFSESITFHFNDETLHVVHAPPAHTDGDSFIHFKKANVYHMGDLFFNGLYPFIDTDHGGSIDGMIQAVEPVLKASDEKTRFIPGHGPLGTREDLTRYLDMLKTARDAIRNLVEQGKSREEVIAAKPTQALDEKWGGGFMAPDEWVGIVYDGMTKR